MRKRAIERESKRVIEKYIPGNPSKLWECLRSRLHHLQKNAHSSKITLFFGIA